MRLFLGLMLLVMCGCATTKPIEPQKLTQIHRVGTISLLGDKINLVQVGTTVFNNVNSYNGVAEWNIDGFTVAEIQRQLAKNTSITPVPIAYQQSDFSEIYLSQLSFPYTDYDIASVKSKLIAIGKSNGIDTLLLVLSRRLDMTGYNHYIHGYGVFSRSLLGVEVGSSFSLGLTIAVVDLQTQEILSESAFSVVKPLDRGVWKDSISKYSEAERALLKSYALDGIKSEIPVSLGKLGLLK